MASIPRPYRLQVWQMHRKIKQTLLACISLVQSIKCNWLKLLKVKTLPLKHLAKAYDYVQQIGKTPIVVNDSRGFFTSRVFGTFVQEGLRLLA